MYKTCPCARVIGYCEGGEKKIGSLNLVLIISLLQGGFQFVAENVFNVVIGVQQSNLKAFGIRSFV